MGSLIVTEFISLDGVIEDPAWTFEFWNDEIAQFKATEFNADNAQLIGRITYEGFAAAWPNSEDEGAEVINNQLKYVVSTTLKNAEWNNSHIISENIVEEIQKLKDTFDGDIVVSGSATLVNFLLKNDLVDMYHLLVYPVVVGTGKRLFQEGTETKLQLVEARTFSSGVVLQRYQPIRS